ncbi:hypothetical protein OK074_0187 [Actinobacteria bacterium OK074]|nr:hypothetical protein OK074_0187 [Actinobacteria bacterium OK074]
MNGARAVARALQDAGAGVCSAGPGTSGIPFVAALDEVPTPRAVPCLFEGVATGGRRRLPRPGPDDRAAAVTLPRLGLSPGNGPADPHSARRAATPWGDPARDHAICHVRRCADVRESRPEPHGHHPPGTDRRGRWAARRRTVDQRGPVTVAAATAVGR